MAKKYIKEHINSVIAALETLSGKPILSIEILEELNEFISYLTNGEMKIAPAEKPPIIYNPYQLQLFRNELPGRELDESYMELKKLAEKALANPLLFGVKEINLGKTVRRLDFLGIKPGEKRPMLLVGMNLIRKEMPNILCNATGTIKTHFTMVKSRIGQFSDEELYNIITCSDEYYTIHYLPLIEDNRQIHDKNYIKKKKI